MWEGRWCAGHKGMGLGMGSKEHCRQTFNHITSKRGECRRRKKVGERGGEVELMTTEDGVAQFEQFFPYALHRRLASLLMFHHERRGMAMAFV